MASFGEHKEEILRKIYHLKHSENPHGIIDCKFENTAYQLALLTSLHVDDEHMIHLLTKWRRQHEWWFPSQFNVTLGGTARWLKTQVIGAPDRLLFMIRVDKECLGHVGLFRFNFKERSCEIDNIVRGEDGRKGIMGSAIVHMMKWGKEHLGLERYDLQTFSDNVKSLTLYTRLGFTEVKRVPLVRVEKHDTVEWSDAPVGFCAEALRHNVFMELTDFDRA
jgi:RimJ/RimL family protein N-acetyltransferase